MSENRINNNEQLALDDGRRVKVLSPGMMVFKRFIRNKLAIAGIIILTFMFVFSFLGGVISPYRQDQVFYKTDSANKEYASAVVNNEYRFFTPDGAQLSTLVRANFSRVVKDAGEDDVAFEADGASWNVHRLGENFYAIGTAKELGSVTMLGKIVDVKAKPGEEISDAVKDAALKAVQGGSLQFEADGQSYMLTKGKAKSYTLGTMSEAGVASLLNFNAFSGEDDALVSGYGFRRAAELALRSGEQTFEADGEAYRLDSDGDDSAVIYRANSDEAMASVSNVIVSPMTTGATLEMDYKAAVAEAISQKQMAFEYVNAAGETEKHTIRMRGNNYIIYTEQQTYLIDMYAAPSMAHPLGTDDHGMDVLTRLMYGGRISLMVGFVVMLLENLIGIIIGGISGYFGGWVDTLLMRFVDLFNSIPYYPMMIIAGAIMDAFEHHGHHGLDGRGPRGARPDPVPARAGLHGGHRGHRRQGVPAHLPPPGAQRDAPADRAGHYGPGQHHPDGGHAELPGPGHQVPAGLLGLHHQRGQQHLRDDELLVHLDPRGRADRADGAGLQLRRRRPARRLRSQDEALTGRAEA